MSTYFGITSDSVSTLFGSLNSGSGSSVGSMLGGTGSSTSSLSQYASIKNGSYFKLLRAYYDETSSKDSKSKACKVKDSISTAVDDNKLLKAIDSSAEKMKDSADDLFTSGSDSVFKKKSIKDADGKVTNGYDTDAIYKAVKKYTDSYNDFLDDASESDTKSILNKTKNLVNQTNLYKNLFDKVGISIGKDNKLSVDEKKFKASDMTTAKSIFNGTGSLAYSASVAASYVDYAVQYETSRANTYNSVGNYSYNYGNGSIYDSLS